MPKSSESVPLASEGANVAAGAECSHARPVETVGYPAGEDAAVVPYNAEEARIVGEQMEREQAELNMYKAVLGSIYSCRKPRDVMAGASSGVKTIARGVGLGVASLVAQPYIGAKTNGVKGFAKGLGAGLATFTASSVVGTVVGTGQIVRGVVNTPGAIYNAGRGKVWNAEKRRWEEDWYSLPEEEAEVFGCVGGSLASRVGAPNEEGGGSSSSGAGRRAVRKVADNTYYEILGVTADATEPQIRKAFYKKSLALHPDKNPNNPEATRKFQEVSDAYRVLGDEERRRVYDEHGKDSAAAGMPKIEPAVFFAALFGSHHFEPLVGRLRLAQDIDGDLQALLREAAAAGADEDSMNIDVLKLQRSHDQMKTLQREREVRCAVLLARRVEPLVLLSPDADEAAQQEALTRWKEEQSEEIGKLVKVPCGVEMMYLIGWVYCNRSRQFFAGSMVKRAMAKVEGKVHYAQTKAKMAGSVGKTAFRVNGIMKTAEKKRKSLEGKQKTEEGAEAGKEDGQASAPSSAPDARRQGGPTGEEEEADDRELPLSSDEEAEEPDAGQRTNGASAQPAPVGAGRSESGSQGARQGAAPASPAAPQEPAQLPLGSVVMVRGLKNAAELNDEVGMVCEFDASSGRYLVQILPSGGLKSLRPENIVPIDTGAGGAEPMPTSARSGGSTSSSAQPGTSGSATNGRADSEPPKFNAEDGQYGMPGEDAEIADAFKDCMPLFHDSLWSVTALDIEFTLSRVLQKVLRDMSVNKTVRRQRAEAILQLGMLFMEPMLEQKRRNKAAAANTMLTAPPSPCSESTATAEDASLTGKNGKRSMMTAITRFRPSKFPWKSSAEKKTQKASSSTASCAW
eukprot:TRINITY_DN6918_c0_g2_i1.p1 TRINITY_DN6918_c0_g2~~TRINITY_DN6918_c0_g2_i1.p1  ORF type:complete len:853 (-),score=259.92 TRINITY_DN6918_c0_g2_i1:251-2809(-)